MKVKTGRDPGEEEEEDDKDPDARGDYEESS